MNHIPKELTTHKQWTCYRQFDRKNGKIGKKPYNPITNTPADSTDPSSWVSYEDALKHSKDYDGIGFFFSETDEFCGIDIDGCIHYKDDRCIIEPKAFQIIEDFASYTEISPSGGGIHIIIKGKLPEWSKNKANGFEIYDKKRFFTVTGNMHKYNLIQEKQDTLENFCKIYMSKEVDDNLMSLLQGKWQEKYQSESEADMALAQKLIHKLGPNIQAIETEMRKSGLCRDKYDQSDSTYTNYLRRTISKAVDTHVAGYNDSDIISKLNAKHAVLSLNGSCLVLNEIDHPVSGTDITFSRFDDFKKLYLNQKVAVACNDDKIIYRKIADIWLESKYRRQYDGIIFSPEKKNSRYYNLYRGFGVSPQEGDWSLFKEHIYEVIASSDQKIYEYIIAWMAHVVQFPGAEQKPGVSIVLQGKQGTGKGVFVNNLGKIFGSHYLHLSNSNQLTGKFNSFLKDKILVYADESVWTGNKFAEGVLKTMVTEDTLLIEPKGKEAFNIKNHIRLILSSNNDWIIPAGMEERRFFVVEVSDKHMRNYDYFDKLKKSMDNGGREAMLFDLQKFDLSGHNLREFPRTNALMNQIVKSMPSEYKWWHERLLEGSQTSNCSEWKDKVSTEALYNDYKLFAETVGYKKLVSIFALGRQLKKMCPSIIMDDRITESGSQKTAKGFPDLAESRKEFARQVNIDIDWQ